MLSAILRTASIWRALGRPVSGSACAIVSDFARTSSRSEKEKRRAVRGARDAVKTEGWNAVAEEAMIVLVIGGV